MSKRSALWVRSNWAEISGIPLPDAGTWALRDTPLSLAALRGLKERGLVSLETPSPVPVDGSATQRPSQQKLWETPPAVFDHIGRASVSVSRETVEEFAARPESDLLVVDVFDSAPRSVADVVMDAASEHDLDVQVVGVGLEEPDEYPGESCVQVDEWDVDSTEFRAIPSADLLSVSTGVNRAFTTPAIVEQADPVKHVVNPSMGMVVEAVEAFILGLDDPHAGKRFSPRTTRPSDPDQSMLANWDPNQVVEGEIEFGTGQGTLTELMGGEVRADGGQVE